MSSHIVTRTLKVTLLENNVPVKWWAVSRVDDPWWIFQIFEGVLKYLFRKETITTIAPPEMKFDIVEFLLTQYKFETEMLGKILRW